MKSDYNMETSTFADGESRHDGYRLSNKFNIFTLEYSNDA